MDACTELAPADSTPRHVLYTAAVIIGGPQTDVASRGAFDAHAGLTERLRPGWYAAALLTGAEAAARGLASDRGPDLRYAYFERRGARVVIPVATHLLAETDPDALIDFLRDAAERKWRDVMNLRLGEVVFSEP
jgi:hypothetical protein